MVEVKIIAVNPHTHELTTSYELFSTFEAAEIWGKNENAKVPGSVVDIIDEMDWNHTENKYEYMA